MNSDDYSFTKFTGNIYIDELPKLQKAAVKRSNVTLPIAMTHLQ